MPVPWLAEAVGRLFGWPLVLGWGLGLDELSRLVQYAFTASVPPAAVTSTVNAGFVSACPLTWSRASQEWHRPVRDGDGVLAGWVAEPVALTEAEGLTASPAELLSLDVAEADGVSVLFACADATACTAVDEAWLE